MGGRSQYLVYKGKSAVWMHNKKEALAFAEKHGAKVKIMPYNNDTWDLPTAIICSDPIEKKKKGKKK